MKISPIASGSNGNCVYVETDTARILVDVGISFKEFSKRMETIDRDPRRVDACFVSHEHTDHISGVGVIARKLHIPIYMTQDTYRYARDLIGEIPNLHIIKNDEMTEIGDTKVHSYPKLHDAADPVSFVIQDNGHSFGVLTDIGYPCENTKRWMKQLDGVLVETNYDLCMLEECRYPKFLKNRIAGDNGHLSNEDCGLLLLENATNRLKRIFLGHLSANSNTPDLAYQTVKAILAHRKDLNEVEVSLTSRNRCTGIYDI